MSLWITLEQRLPWVNFRTKTQFSSNDGLFWAKFTMKQEKSSNKEIIKATGHLHLDVKKIETVCIVYWMRPGWQSRVCMLLVGIENMALICWKVTKLWCQLRYYCYPWYKHYEYGVCVRLLLTIYGKNIVRKQITILTIIIVFAYLSGHVKEDLCVKQYEWH